MATRGGWLAWPRDSGTPGSRYTDPLAGDGTETADGTFIANEAGAGADATWQAFKRWPFRSGPLVRPNGETSGRASTQLPKGMTTGRAARAAAAQIEENTPGNRRRRTTSGRFAWQLRGPRKPSRRVHRW